MNIEIDDKVILETVVKLVEREVLKVVSKNTHFILQQYLTKDKVYDYVYHSILGEHIRNIVRQELNALDVEKNEN